MRLPYEDFRRTAVPDPAPLHEGLDALAHGAAGRLRALSAPAWRLRRRARRVHAASLALEKVSDARLDESLRALHERALRQDRHSAVVEDEAFAVVSEVAFRTMGLRPHMVQVMGALGLASGVVVEMATGEGKSLTASLAAAVAGWSGRPCHVMTVNDYLAARDAEELAPFYRRCGLTVGAVTGELEPGGRREQHRCDVVYTTSHQLLADFLRDRLMMGGRAHPTRRLVRDMLRPGAGDDGLVLRGLDTAIVDEADSILVDEAVTPLIIARPSENRPLVESAGPAARIARSLVVGRDYEIDRRARAIRLTEKGRARIEESSAELGGIWRSGPRRVEMVLQALTAMRLFLRDRQYVVDNEKIVIVDDFTGRLMPDRTWSHGLHQAVEAVEGVPVTSPTETLARLSFQRFFRLFRRLAGMSGTVSEASDELWHVYELRVVCVPPNRPCARRMLPDLAFPTAEAKLAAIVRDVTELHAAGRPVLIGTRTVAASQELSRRLEAAGVPFALLNATRHREEAQIVAGAGQPGRVTVATNMAGRGTDIKLGAGVREQGGLHVIAAERNESGRVDRQLYGRCARQGDPGTARAYLSPEDDLLERFVPGPARRLLALALSARLPGAARLAGMAFDLAQVRAQALAYRQRCSVMAMDEWLEEALAFSDRAHAF